MLALTDLWLPILVSSVVVFFASFLAWMVLPHHKPDIKFLDDEDAFAKTLKAQSIKPGVYMFPGCDPASMKTDEGKARFKAGPWGTLSVQAGPPNFGRNLLLVFVFYIVVSVFVAYLARLAPSAGTDFMSTFRVAGAAGVACYCLGGIPHGVFFGRPLRATMMDLIDGVVYGLLTGAVFAFLWPATQTTTILGS